MVKTINYRKDIDGLRAIAVLSVILFHLGYLPDGYLGVDIFFTISGYLITKIVYNEAREDRFSISKFYLRRIRRIIPLVLSTTFVALLIGIFVMLPDDLENLSQSVFATNIFANNILLLITTGNYWDVVNEYKPLMHTWSLGVEEQFYVAYPLIFLFLNGKRSRWIMPVLLILTTTSLFLFTSSSNEPSRFYSIQFRFFELSFGGLGAIIFNDKLINSRYKLIFVPIVLVVLLLDINLSGSIKLLLIVTASAGLLISENNKNKSGTYFLENKIMVGIGKISFSLFMWHQIVLAYTRYFITHDISFLNSVFIFIIVILLSILSYFIIEQPFRDKTKINTKTLLCILSIAFITTCSLSLYIYKIKGIVRDVPELELYKSGSYNGNIHIRYNEKIYDLNKKFTANEKIKILVIGNSFSRDWANILLESKFAKLIEVSYVYDINECEDINERLSNAKFIFFSETKIKEFKLLAKKFSIDTLKCWNVGTKNFGSNNGIFYTRRGSNSYCNQRTDIDAGFLERNNDLKNQWGRKYIDLIGMIADNNGNIPVFTPDCKFISQDCRHLTHAGAVYFAQLLDNNQIFKPE